MKIHQIAALLVFFLACFIIDVLPQEDNGMNMIGKTVISTVDKLRIRESASLNSEIAGYLNMGETALVRERSAGKMKVGERMDFWYRVNAGSLNGWAFGGFITDLFDQSADKKITLWLDYSTSGEGKISVHHWNGATNKKSSYKKSLYEWGECLERSLSPDGRYFALNCGTYAISELTFYIAESGAKVLSMMHDGGTHLFADKAAEWSGTNTMKLNAVVWDSGGTCYATSPAVFKDGKAVYGKERSFGGNCANTFIVSVPILNIFDSPSTRGKIIDTRKLDDVVEMAESKPGDPSWIKLIHNDGNAWVQKKNLKPARRN
ncbi:MAG: SH3 domain-containing protein [Spirochaetes bacterium]|nr:SH3 domain-containing protein [Spirochaetota bacterium]